MSFEFLGVTASILIVGSALVSLAIVVHLLHESRRAGDDREEIKRQLKQILGANGAASREIDPPVFFGRRSNREPQRLPSYDEPVWAPSRDREEQPTSTDADVDTNQLGRRIADRFSPGGPPAVSSFEPSSSSNPTPLIDTWAQRQLLDSAATSTTAPGDNNEKFYETLSVINSLVLTHQQFNDSLAQAMRDLNRAVEGTQSSDLKWIAERLEHLNIAIETLAIDQLRCELATITHTIPSMRPIKDRVDCSVFAPPGVSEKANFEVQVLLHLRNDLMKAAKAAILRDPEANRRAFATLQVAIERGSSVDLYLDCQGLQIRNPIISIKWIGQPTRAIFVAHVPAYGTPQLVDLVLHVGLNGIPIGEISFTVAISSNYKRAESAGLSLASAMEVANSVESLEPCGSIATRFTRPFISYSRKDFDVVSFFAQGLEESGAKPSVDVTSLEPGDDWAKKLQGHIDSADVFYLMWSDNAALSEWVGKEAGYAVNLHNANLEGMPKIRPIPLHQPWPRPPEHLRRFHFYSQWQAHRAAQRIGLTDE